VLTTAPTSTPSWTARYAGVFGYLRLDIRRSLRDRQYVAVVIAWPVAAYLLFSTVFGSHSANRSENLDPRVEIMVAMAAFGAIGAVLMATGPRLALERSNGWLRQLRLTPLSVTAALATRVSAAMVLTLPSIVLTFAVAAAVNGVRLSVWQWTAMTLLIGVGCLPFAALGLAIGCVSDGETAMGMTLAVYLTFAALGGLWMPVKILPGPMQTIAHALPSNAVAELGWRLAAGTTPPVGAAAVIGAWLVGSSALAAALSSRLAVRS
jgi:ABC-2 type transport system permease protein